ncbi:Uncharacterised protein [Acinetobacter baumannii]|nr:Uncharacterised protein [Acinetobacter baumannii]
MLGVLVDDGGVAGDHRAVRGDQHLEALRVDLLAVAEAVEVPDDADFDLALFQGGDHRVGQRQAALLGDLAEELQARLDVLLVAAVGDGRGEHPIDRLGGSADVADGDLVLALQQVGPAVRYVLHQLFVDDEGDGPGVGECPVAVLVLGPGRDLFPGARLVRLADALLHGDGAEGGADVADVGAGVVLLGLELGQLLGRTHVGIHVLEPILALKVLPGVLPVRPAVGHADAVDLAFLARGLFQRLQVRFGGQRQAAAEGDGGSQQ